MNKLINTLYNKINKFYDTNPNGIVFVVWATATWKTNVSIQLINKWINAEIISADSRQIYKFMDIWTDKVSHTIRKKIPHYQIDILYPDQPYTAGKWKQDTEKIIEDIQNRNKKVFVVWGTGLYIDMLYKNYTIPEVDPDYNLREVFKAQEKKQPGILYKKLQKIDPQEAKIISPNNIRYIIRALEIYTKTWHPKSKICKQAPVKRPMYIVILWREKEDTNKRINKRIKEMIQQWLIEEVNSLLKMWYSPNLQSMQWIGYKEIVWYLQNQYDLETAIEKLKKNTHYYAKKQRTWFRKYIKDSLSPKKNVQIEVFRL